MMNSPEIYPVCETAIVVKWGDRIEEEINRRVHELKRLIIQNPFPGFLDAVPAYSTLTIYYQPELLIKEQVGFYPVVKKWIMILLSLEERGPVTRSTLVTIPVCYDEEYGIDLGEMASAQDLSKEAVISMHSQREYLTYMMGFLPGFAYMGQVADAIATPRRETPRLMVEEGSVGIAGKQTGIYPLSSPGGWQIIGRTPLTLFDPGKNDPFLFRAGDRVKFEPVSRTEFNSIKSTQVKRALPETTKPIADAVVIKAGPFSTIQDAGRFGYRSYGVPVSGAMDLQSHFIANALVGNYKNAAGIECTMGGLVIQFKKDTVVAITGAGAAYVNHRVIQKYQPLTLYRNDQLEIRYNNDGIRTYIAVRGGIDVPLVMNSRSTYTRAGIGSVLKKGDTLSFGNDVRSTTGNSSVSFSFPEYTSQSVIRIMEGPEQERMQKESRDRLYAQPFALTHQCDRMGYKLQADPLKLIDPSELISTAVTIGTIQLTPNGQLVLLMSDCQTTGGYPRVAQVAAVDLPIAAQLKPGDSLRFTNISIREAEDLYLIQQNTVNEYFR